MHVTKGQIFENWVVLSDKLLPRQNANYVLCKCIKCNETEKYIQANKLVKLLTKQCSECSSKERFKYKGFSNLERRYYTRVKSRAKSKKIPFNLTIEYMFSLIKKQEFKCKLSGLDINLYNDKATVTASLDRKNSLKGYVKSNVQWVHKDINTMKNDFSEEYFLSLVCQIHEHKKLKNAENL